MLGCKSSILNTLVSIWLKSVNNGKKEGRRVLIMEGEREIEKEREAEEKRTGTEAQKQRNRKEPKNIACLGIPGAPI